MSSMRSFSICSKIGCRGADFSAKHKPSVGLTLSCFPEGANDKMRVMVRAGGGEREWLGGVDDHVWFPELPAFYELRHSRQVGGIAFDCALFDPFLNARDFVIREAQLIREFRLPRFWQPWRHKAAPCHRGNLPGVRFSIDISEQWKRCVLALPMAVCARVMKDRGNVTIKRD